MPIVLCTCTHSDQDKMYGSGRRVANVLKGDIKVRCTVCKKEHPYVKSDLDRVLEKEQKGKKKK